MALMLIKQILDSKNNESKLSAGIVVDPTSGKSVLDIISESINLLKDGTTDGSGSLAADYNTLSKLAGSLADLKVTVNDFLTGEDNEGDIDRLSELVKAIQANKDSIDALVMNNLTSEDIVDALTSADSDKVLSAAQGKALKDLIDALEASLTAKIESIHVFENQDALDKISETANGDLSFNGKVLDGATSVAVITEPGGTPVFNDKLVLVVSALGAGD